MTCSNSTSPECTIVFAIISTDRQPTVTEPVTKVKGFVAGILPNMIPAALDTQPIISIAQQTLSSQAKSSRAWLVPITTSAPERPVLTILPVFSASSIPHDIVAFIPRRIS